MAECNEDDSQICRFRGDTVSIKRQVTQEGSPSAIDITGYSFLMTVNSVKDPDIASSPETGEQAFQIVGVITDGPSGRFEFPYTDSPNPGEILNTGTYYYDMQMTDTAGQISTIAKGKYVIKQDITK